MQGNENVTLKGLEVTKTIPSPNMAVTCFLPSMHKSLQENGGRSILLGDEFLTMSAEPVAKVRLNIASLKRHVHITGTTGSGKSTTAKVICAGLAENHVPTVVLDRTG